MRPGKLQLDITSAWIAVEGRTNRNQLVYYVYGTLLSAIDAWLLRGLKRIALTGIYVEPSRVRWDLKGIRQGKEGLA